MKFSSLALLTSSAVATLCSNTSYPYAGKTISVPLVPVTTAQAGPVNGTLINPPTISGTIEITSGCGFTVKNFTFTPVGTSVYSFYGIQKANASLADRLVTANLTATSGATTSFSFIQDLTGFPPVSYNDISGIEIFEEGNDIVWAVAKLPEVVANSTLPPTNTSSGTPKATLTPAATSGTGRVAVAGLIFALVAIAAL